MINDVLSEVPSRKLEQLQSAGSKKYFFHRVIKIVAAKQSIHLLKFTTGCCTLLNFDSESWERNGFTQWKVVEGLDLSKFKDDIDIYTSLSLGVALTIVPLFLVGGLEELMPSDLLWFVILSQDEAVRS